MAQRLVLNDRQVWLKQYGNRSRRFTLGLLDKLARGLSIDALRPPPHHRGEQALSNEVRRVRELQAARVNVPDVIGQGHSTLLLADIGASLSSCLKRLRADAPARNRLVAMAVQAIADVHAKGLYLGNPAPRNMTFDNECIGFLDFEEDPGEVMTLDSAQARDWLVFLHGVVRHYPAQHEDLARLLQAGLAQGRADVTRRVLDAGSKLERVTGLFWPLRRGDGKVRSALRTLRYIAGNMVLLAFVWIQAMLIEQGSDLGDLNLMGTLV